MFKTLMDLWKGKNFLTAVLGSFEDMLKHAETLFAYAVGELVEDTHGKTDKKHLYALDRDINKLERGIRKRIVEHLSIQPAVDVPTCLVLMSVVKDAERLGDYAKNLYEVSEMLETPFTRTRFNTQFGGLDDQIKGLYERTRKAFISSDEALAREVINEQHKIVKQLDDLVARFAQGTLSTNEAVCSALTARYLKRFAAHLGNIASAVIMPVSDLDYFDEKV